MATVSVYLTFRTQCEAAFTRYREIFGGDFSEGGLRRFGDMPPHENSPPMDAAVAQLVMHVGLPILGGFELMGSDAPEAMCGPFQEGSSVHINLQPDKRAEADRLFAADVCGDARRYGPERSLLGRLLRQLHRPLWHPLDDQLRLEVLKPRPARVGLNKGFGRPAAKMRGSVHFSS